MSDNITIPRSLLAALVDPQTASYIDGDTDRCVYCDGKNNWAALQRDIATHTIDCPIRQAQELLAAATGGEQ